MCVWLTGLGVDTVASHKRRENSTQQPLDALQRSGELQGAKGKAEGMTHEMLNLIISYGFLGKSLILQPAGTLKAKVQYHCCYSNVLFLLDLTTFQSLSAIKTRVSHSGSAC